MRKRIWRVCVAVGLLVLLATGCGPVYRRDPHRRLSRRIVRRERNILHKRLNRWRGRIARIFDQEDDVLFARRTTRRLKQRVRRGRLVLRMLNRKLRRYERKIPFSRNQWRRARNIGCRVYR